MNWDKKSITATLLSLVFVIGYWYYLQQKYPDFYANQGRTEEVAQSPDPQPGIPPKEEIASAAAVDPAAPADVNALDTAPLPEDQLTFDTETRVIRFDQKSGAIASIKMKQYAQGIGDAQPSELLDSPMVLQGTTQILNRTGRSGFAAKREGDSLTLTRREGNWEIAQVYTVPKSGYGLDVRVSFKNTGADAQELTAGTLVQENLRKPAGGSFFNPSTVDDAHFIHSIAGKRNDVNLREYCESGEGAAVSLSNEVVEYMGLDKHYFLTSLWAKGQKFNYLIERSGPGAENTCPMALVISQQFGLVQPGQSVEMKLEGFFGPKKSEILEAYDPALKNAINFGFFAIVAKPLLAAMKWTETYVHNWGIAIILVTLVLKVLFYPLTKSSAVSMKRMQKLQPEMNALREKYKEDPQRQQRELMAFMSKNKVNPFKGCLPILPQIPVFMAFYTMLSISIELRHAPFFGWVQDLSVHDPFYITPILLGAAMFLQQKLTPNPAMDKNQEKIMLMMPLVFSLMMLSLPAGMVIYMLTNTIVSIAQQQWLNKRIARELG